MRAHLTPLVIGLTAGFAGVLLALLCYTAWIDHQRLTAIWDLEQRRALASAQAPAK